MVGTHTRKHTHTHGVLITHTHSRADSAAQTHRTQGSLAHFALALCGNAGDLVWLLVCKEMGCQGRVRVTRS